MNSSQEHWKRLEEVFDDALDRSPQEQAVLLEQLAKSEPHIAEEVGRLLETHRSGTANFLQPPDESDTDPHPGVVSTASTIGGFLRRGTRVGSCELEDVLGSGGMAVVYRATQRHPRRTVAVKLIRPGIATAEVVRRFELEAEILGRLDHPGIATIHEAGTTDTGEGPQPFFVMERVDGLPLDVYAAKHKPSQPERLQLLAQICDAVQHAHQKGIIHRDLKPENILVTPQGQPKILDFGVARVTAEDCAKTTATDFGQVIGTLHYLSPEQASGEPDALDTRSDVYALGVIGYELLSGQRPHALEACMLHEAIRVIQEEEPTRLSVLDHGFRGDVETMIATALAKETHRRYQSASDLAEDIRRHLRDEPISARRASLGYHLSKFARRHRLVFASAAAIAIALVTAAVGSLVGMKKAQAAAAARQETMAFMRSGFFGALQPDAYPTPLRRSLQPTGVDESLPVIQLLRHASAELDSWFEQEPKDVATLHMLFGDAHYGLRDFDTASQRYEAALATLERSGSQREQLECLAKLASVHLARQSWQAAKDAFEDVYRQQASLLGPDHPDTLRSRHQLAVTAERLEDVEHAEAEYQAILTTSRQTLGPEHRLTIAVAMSLGALYWDQERNEDSRRMYADVLEHLGPEDWRRVSAEWSLAILDARQEQTEAAGEHYERALQLAKDQLGPRHDRTRTALHGFAGWLRRTGQTDKLESLYLDDIVRSFSGDTTAVHNLASHYFAKGALESAEFWCRLAVETRAESPRAWELPLSLDLMSRICSKQDKPHEATEWSRQAVELDIPASYARQRAHIWCTYGKSLIAVGQLDAARDALEESLRANDGFAEAVETLAGLTTSRE